MRWLLFAAIVVGCHHGAAYAPIDRSKDARLTCAEDPSRSNVPEIPSREQCLLTPYVPSEPIAESLTHERCAGKDRRDYVFTHAGTRAMTGEERLQFLERHRKELHALPGIRSSGFGVCCDSVGTTGGCVRVGVALCTQKLAELAQTIESWWIADGNADATLAMVIDLDGLPGPRCDGKSGPCLPVPYEHVSLAHEGYRCDAPRVPNTHKNLSWGT